MTNAPLVIYPVGRFYWGAGVCLVLWLIGGTLNISLLLKQQIRPEYAMASGLVLLAVAVAWVRAGAGAGASLPRWLVWDGQKWHWAADALGEPLLPVSRVDVQLDFQQILLLRLIMFPSQDRNSPLQEWVWLYKGFAPELWHGIRCAVYSRQR